VARAWRSAVGQPGASAAERPTSGSQRWTDTAWMNYLSSSGSGATKLVDTPGTKLWLPDAQQGWCASGSFTSSGSDATCK